MNSVRWITWLKILFGLLLLAGLSFRVDWRTCFDLMSRVDGVALFFAICIPPAGIWLSAVKWFYLLQSQNIPCRLVRLVSTYWVGFFANNFFPSGVGGDVIRVVLLRNSAKMSEIAASVMVERMSGLLVLFTWAACGLSLVSAWFPPILYLLMWGGVTFGLITMFFLYFSPRHIISWVEGFVSKFLPYPIIQSGAKKFRVFALAFVNYHGQPRAVIVAICLSVPFYLISFLAQWLLFQGTGVDVSMSTVFVVAPLVALVSLLPVTLNGIGVTEGAFVYCYGLFGVSPEAALSVALLSRFLSILISSVGGILWLGWRSVPKES